MKILSAPQIREWDAYTIQQEPITSIDLMENACLRFVDWFCQHYHSQDGRIKIFCGPGNNGGDGLAIARLLHYRFYDVEIFRCKIGENTSPDFDYNLDRLPSYQAVPVTLLEEGDELPDIAANDLVIDALFGSGLNRSIGAYWASLIQQLNSQANKIIAVDIPSGLFADQPSDGAIIQATQTFSFEIPKLAFLFPENHGFVGEWYYDSIGLHTGFLKNADTTNYYITPTLVRSILKQRNKFDHKGTFGHVLLVMGSYGKVGAAILAARGALRSGTGLVSIHAPKCAYPILQMAIPEAMVSVDVHETLFSEVKNSNPFQAIGVGCGLGTNEITFQGLAHLLVNTEKPMVIDADALNIIAQHPALFSAIPAGSILSPHPKEFSRLFGESPNDFARNELQRRKSLELNCYIILKGANTAIACPNGNCYFNSTGNPGMATAGSGDVLTGILSSLLAQGYSSQEACLLGVYLHGLSGDLAAEKVRGLEALIASDIIDHLGDAFLYLQEKERFSQNGLSLKTKK